MERERRLPEMGNPLIAPDRTPSQEILIERRRLGQTKLAVQPGQVGTSSATKYEHLGIFDYVHLRAPLPKNLKGSGVFTTLKNEGYPESYFLMRRSNDGYVSATGMFKTAFPWASLEEEEFERKYLKTLPGTASDEIAGSVWLTPEIALEVAEDYGMRPWIEALLDPEPVQKSNKEKSHVASPPKFDLPNLRNLSGTPSLRSRGRELRSTSPTKTTPLARKFATPRKSRASKQAPKVGESPFSSSYRHETLENGIEISEADSSLRASVDRDKVVVEVDRKVELFDNTETSITAVKVDIPATHPGVAVTESTEEMLAREQ